MQTISWLHFGSCQKYCQTREDFRAPNPIRCQLAGAPPWPSFCTPMSDSSEIDDCGSWRVIADNKRFNQKQRASLPHLEVNPVANELRSSHCLFRSRIVDGQLSLGR